MLKTSDVGHRVVVRRYVGIGPEGRDLFTDLLGELVEIDEERFVIRTQDGVEHTIPRADVAAGKRIPPRPVRYSEIVALERIADAAWPAPIHERLGEWFLRAAQGWTNRANSALPLGDPGQPIDDAISACQAWYADHGLTPRITVPLPLRRDLADALRARGWHAQPLVLVQAANVADLVARPRSEAATELFARPSPDFLKVIAARKESLPEAAHHVLSAVPAVRFAEVREGGALLGLARGAVVGEWMHLGLVEVVASARGRGLARQVTQALAQWAAERGATRAVLQVEEDNVPATTLYGRMGFATHHRYVTFRAPAGE